MPRHWSLPRRQPFIFLNQHHSLPSRIHIRGERRKTTSFHVGVTNRWLEETTASKMIRARIRVSRVYMCVYACSKIYLRRSATKEETTAFYDTRLCMTSARQVQLTRLFRTEQGALSRGSLGTLMAESSLASMSPSARNVASPDVRAVDTGI